MLVKNGSLNETLYYRYEAALEEARTVDRIVACLGEKALDALASDSPFLGQYKIQRTFTTIFCNHI